jgi:serine/threonine protein kinase
MGDPRPLRLPEQFGKYSLLGHLATGGMAEVYVARQAGLQGFEKIVVIKCVRGELEGDVETTGFFLDEARLVATLEHPNIAQVYEIGLVNSSYFFVMEYVHGADLRQLMEVSLKREEPVPLADAIYIASHVCAALHCAHEKRDRDGSPLNIIHRDVSPSNVLLSHDGAVKLCDFGIAKAQNRTTETVRGSLKGKYSYMSPEQCRARDLDRRSDVFAMGIVLYELTTLTRLFKMPSDFELLRAIVEEPIPPPSTRVPDYPPELERIVMRALEKEPAARYQTAQEMQLDLEAFARENKLPQSSVHIAALMGKLFEKRVQAWVRAQSQGKGIEDYLMDTAARPSGQLPTFMPLGSGSGSGNTETGEDIEVVATQPARKSQTPISSAVVEPGPKRASVAWLVGVVLAGAVGVGELVAERALTKSASGEHVAALKNDVDKVSSAFDAAARSAHLKADGMVTAPMLRAAIATDASTMRDLVTNEHVFSVGSGEMIEVFQLRDGEPVSLARLPSTSPPLKPLKSGETRVDIVKQHAFVAAAAPIAGAGGTGVLVVAVPVDLASAVRAIAGHVTAASIDGSGGSVTLVPPSDGSHGQPVRIAFPPTTDWNASEWNIVAAPISVASSLPSWAWLIRYAAFGGAGLLLVGYLIARARARR